MGNKGIKVFNIILVILTILMAFPILFNIYLQIWGKDLLPTGVTSTYVTTVKDPQTSEEKEFIEASYYANYNGKGNEVVELLFNGYSGVDKQAVYSRGFQLVINADGSNNLYYYDKYQGVSFETGHEYKWGNPIFVDIDGETYAVKLDGQYTVTSYSIDWAEIVRTWCCLGLNYLFEKPSWNNTNVDTYSYTVEDLMLKIKSIIKSSSNNTGMSVIPLIDLGDFLHVYELDEEGAVSNESIGADNIKNSYFTMKTFYDRRGITIASQSMFKSVAYDSDYNVSGLLTDVEYWQVGSKYVVTEEDFTVRETSKGNYYYLSYDKMSEIKDYSNLDINVVFDIDRLNDDNLLGLDYSALMGIKVKSLTISGTGNISFELLENSLKNTSLTSINHSSNIKIINKNSGVDV